MRKKRTTQKKDIQILVLVVAGFLLIYSLATASPMGLARSAQFMLASAIGVSAGVPENPINSLVQQLKDQQAELDAREAALLRRENERLFDNNKIALFSFGTSLVLFALVGANFYLDMKRGRRKGATTGGLSVDLRRHR